MGLTSNFFSREGKIFISLVPSTGVNSGGVQEFVGHCSCRRTYQLKMRCSEILNIYPTVLSVGQIPRRSGAVLLFGLYISQQLLSQVSQYGGVYCTFLRGVSLKTRRGNYICYLLFCIHVAANYSLYYAQSTVLIMIT